MCIKLSMIPTLTPLSWASPPNNTKPNAGHACADKTNIETEIEAARYEQFPSSTARNCMKRVESPNVAHADLVTHGTSVSAWYVACQQWGRVKIRTWVLAAAETCEKTTKKTHMGMWLWESTWGVWENTKKPKMGHASTRRHMVAYGNICNATDGGKCLGLIDLQLLSPMVKAIAGENGCRVQI